MEEGGQNLFPDITVPFEDIVVLVVPPESQKLDKKRRGRKKSITKKPQMNIIEPIRLGYTPVVNPVPKTIIETALERAKLEKFQKSEDVDVTISHSNTLQNGLQQCKLCNQLFRTSQQIHDHMKIHYAPPKHQVIVSHPCKHCGKEFPKLTKLKIHENPCAQRLEKQWQKNLIREVSFICTICKKIYARKNGLKKHFYQTSHLSDHKILSDVSYSQMVIKKQIKRKLQEEVIDLYTCPHCFRLFESHALLTNHMQSNYDGCAKKYFKYRCKNCNEVMSYSGVNGHKCARVFYKCFVCAEKFTIKAELQAHLQSRHAKKCYVCIICKKEVYAPFLKAHKRSHMKLGVYECNECNAGFNTKFDLERHLDKQHGGKMFTCQICRRIYFSRKEYIAHFMLHDA